MLTPMQKIKREILARIEARSGDVHPSAMTPEQVDATWNDLDDDFEDAKSEFRSSGTSTNLPCESSRHYSSEAVAAKMLDGTWVGWTYWFGGGKHGEPEAIDWMADAYEVECRVVEKPVLEFSLPE